MKIDIEIYKVFIDLHDLLSKGLVQINDIEDLGIESFLETIRAMDADILRSYEGVFSSINKIKKLRAGTKPEKALNALSYSSAEELKQDLFYLPRTNHQLIPFGEIKIKMGQIEKDNPKIFEDLTEKGGLLKTINFLVDKYNIKAKENKNINE